jgi:ubiquinone/menaquinone biosynthesis C-methylase UbiE
MPQTTPSRPNYGLDAPAVVRNLLLAGAAGLLALLARILNLWNDRSTVALVLYPVIGAGLSCGATGLYMMYYSRIGKVRARERHLGRLPWRGDEQVLDIGCGRGLFLIGAARRLSRGGRATGIDLWQAEDLSGNSKEATLANAAAEGVADRVDVQTADARSLPFPDQSFDVILSCAALHNIYDKTERHRAIAEIARVLKPGGRVLIVDIRHTGEYAAALRDLGLASARAHRSLFSHLAALFTFGSVRAGLVIAERNGNPPPRAA